MPPRRRIKSFISENVNYVFPTDQNTLSTNFGNLIPRVDKLAGVNGGFDAYGAARAPQETGDIQVGWFLRADGNTPEATTMTTMRDNVMAMAGSIKGKLISLPENGVREDMGVRWAECRPNNLGLSENADEATEVLQRVNAHFQASDPGWYGVMPNTAELTANQKGWAVFDDGSTFDAGVGLVFGGPRYSANTALSALNPQVATFQVTSRGNRQTLPHIKISGGNSFFTNIIDLRLTRTTVSGAPIEGFLWTPDHGLWSNSGSYVIFDSKAMTVVQGGTLGDYNNYASFVPEYGMGFPTIQPNINYFKLEVRIIDLLFPFTFINIQVSFPDSWY